MRNRIDLATSARRALPIACLGLIAAHAASAQDAAASKGFLPKLFISSTIPDNGDLNPYGVAFVPAQFPKGGAIAPGDVLVSNFNSVKNFQGTGTTIIKFTPGENIAPGVSPGSKGTAQVFFSSKLAGLDTALGVLSGGFVVVGNLPTKDGTFGTIGQGALQIVDRDGALVKTLNDPAYLDSPWDLAISESGGHPQIFVSNVLTGTVSRLDVAVGPSGVSVLQQRHIAKGYAWRPNSAALVLGPTGLAYDSASDTLYVASTADNAIYAVPSAGRRTSPADKGALVFKDPHLRGPLALVFAPNGHLLTANGDAVDGDPKQPSEIIEFTTTGKFVREFNIDAGQGGSFGLATVASAEAPFNFAAVDDVPNVIEVFQSPPSAW